MCLNISFMASRRATDWFFCERDKRRKWLGCFFFSKGVEIHNSISPLISSFVYFFHSQTNPQFLKSQSEDDAVVKYYIYHPPPYSSLIWAPVFRNGNSGGVIVQRYNTNYDSEPSNGNSGRGAIAKGSGMVYNTNRYNICFLFVSIVQNKVTKKSDNKKITSIKRENKYDNTRTRPCLPSPTPSAGWWSRELQWPPSLQRNSENRTEYSCMCIWEDWNNKVCIINPVNL